MYLSQGIQDLAGQRFAMVGLLPLEVRMLPRLKSLGYREITLRSDSLLGPAGTRARGHEFHYSEIITEPSDLERLYLLTGRDSTQERTEGFYRPHILASYVHLHFGSNPEVARHLVEYCAAARRP
jgi:cobyrinic acid a,c-diamide synthase